MNAAVKPDNSPTVAQHDEQFTLLGAGDKRLANMRYRIVTDAGRVITGTTNSLGETERIATDSTERLKLYTTGDSVHE
ncbi:MAG TPA: hypothetical protein VF573_29625 [Paraburkholderia sp.]|uniref:hypothetical protein n=1 Tax=Paraburkholderia sp. TaxID=1926495 RepID=UPI002ED546FB